MKTSVALCSFNGEKFLRQQIDSILKQTLPVDELIISDDGSLDGTVEIIREYKQKHSNLFKIIINPSQLGTIKNFENAVSVCTGEIIFLSDQDDIWLPEKVKETVDFFSKQKNALLLFTNAFLIDDNNNKLKGSLWEKWEFTKSMQHQWKDNKVAFQDLLANRNKVTGATVAFRASLIKSTIPISVRRGYWHDAWFALHAAAMNGLFFSIRPLIKYRIHSEQQIGINMKATDQSDLNGIYISKEKMCKEIATMYPNLFSGDSTIEIIKKNLKKLF